MQLGYKSVLFILHFHLAGMNRGEPGRTVVPPWRTGKNRSVTGVLPAYTWVNRPENRGEPCKRRDEPWSCRGSTWMNRGAPGCSRILRASTVDRRDFSAKKRHFHPVHGSGINRSTAGLSGTGALRSIGLPAQRGTKTVIITHTLSRD